MLTYCFDIDGTLCEQVQRNYSVARPFLERIKSVNRLYDQGHQIIIFTARGSKSGIHWFEETQQQLESWGLRYHKLIVGKPHADVYVDDKAVHSDDFCWS